MNLFQATFLPSAQQYPTQIALKTEKQQFSYQQLLCLSLSWAEVVSSLNPQRGVVAIYGARQWQMYAGILSILAAGSTYMPLNSKLPTARITHIFAQVNCQLLFVAEDEDISELLAASKQPLNIIYLANELPHWHNLYQHHRVNTIAQYLKQLTPKVDISAASSLESAKHAYLLFTSGSTGKPKGIAVSQQNIINHIKRLDELLGIKANDRVSQFFELSFDLSVHDMFSCWAKGAALYVIPQNQLMCPTAFIQQHKITVFSAVASSLSFMDKLARLTPNSLPSLRLSCFGGEKLLTEQALKWQTTAQNSRVLNLYGPTECTITACYYQLDPKQLPRSSSVPIGQALPNVNTLLIKEGQLVTACHEIAELYIAGDQLVEGYWQDNIKTEQAFITLTNAKGHDETYYKTGDLVYLDDNNHLIFYARNDQQFSLAGHRVEAGDIEATILAFSSAITWCSVRLVTLENRAQVIAFIEGESTINKATLRQYCFTQLPHYMVPDKFISFPYLPRNSNGKVDLKPLVTSLQQSEQANPIFQTK